ncbi:uncharacterized protein IL334_000223 [Kwoniella shivajii]|uniref:Uncharacterized protein n=1 Tax=Kwoniella shivajii TaxID=564305 RepID=A0ABZ1CNP7_9TREE|nr:hypothetical protein IL334_000223 [Kwoniella shivajii]
MTSVDTRPCFSFCNSLSKDTKEFPTLAVKTTFWDATQQDHNGLNGSNRGQGEDPNSRDLSTYDDEDNRPKVIILPVLKTGADFKDVSDDLTSRHGVFARDQPEIRPLARISYKGEISERRMRLARGWAAYLSKQRDDGPVWTLSYTFKEGDDVPSALIAYNDAAQEEITKSYFSWANDLYIRVTGLNEDGTRTPIREDLDTALVYTVEDFQLQVPFKKINQGNLPLTREEYSVYVKNKFEGYVMGDQSQSLRSSMAPANIDLFSIIKPETHNTADTSGTSDRETQDDSTI